MAVDHRQYKEGRCIHDTTHRFLKCRSEAQTVEAPTAAILAVDLCCLWANLKIGKTWIMNGAEACSDDAWVIKQATCSGIYLSINLAAYLYFMRTLFPIMKVKDTPKHTDTTRSLCFYYFVGIECKKQ